MTDLKSISEEEIKKGIYLIFDNSKLLITEGDLLLKNKAYARAFALYQLSIEEIGKVQLLFSLLIDLNNKETIDFQAINKDFTSHPEKSKRSINCLFSAVYGMYIQEKDLKKKEEYKIVFSNLSSSQEKGHLAKINDYKNYSLYVSLKEGSFISPTQMISDETAIGRQMDANLCYEASKTLIDSFMKNIEGLCNLVKEFKENPKFSSDAKELFLDSNYGEKGKIET